MGFNLQYRIDLLVRLGAYMLSNEEGWEVAKRKAFADNNWFIPQFVDLSVTTIVQQFLQREKLEGWAQRYELPEENNAPKKIGIVMAGNIPLVGFHDVVAVFLTGHIAVIKPSTKDEALIQQVIKVLSSWDAGAYFEVKPMIKACDAYIATGSNNTSRYFDYYFQKYPNIIRRNRTSVAVLTGDESTEQLEALADDVHQYFGLGCRNVTKLYVPEGYDFVPLLEAFRKYSYFANHNKYKNNYDYNLALHILNNRYYMTNGSLLLIEDASPFAAISQVHYQYYTRKEDVLQELENNLSVQCVVGYGGMTFGQAQCPNLTDYADGIDTVKFLLSLSA